MKRSETIIIESVLYQDLFGTNPSLAKEYGTTELTEPTGKPMGFY